MLERKLIIIPALGHQNKGKSSFTGSGLFVLMSKCGNDHELALQHGGFPTMSSSVVKGLMHSINQNYIQCLALVFNKPKLQAVLGFGKARQSMLLRCGLRTFARKSSYGEIFFISPLELVDNVVTPKMKKKMGVTDFASEKMAVEKCLNFDKSVIIKRCSLLC